MNEIIVIAGPTASGKTNASVSIAKELDTEIVSADSMQVYKYMNIGTAKVMKDEMKGVKHHMLDIIEPFETYNVNDYTIDANKCIDEIIKKGKTPVICGGTGLYINSVIYNFNLTEAVSSPGLREELTELYNEKGGEYLLSELRKFDPETADRLHPNNARRIIRAIEMYKTSGITMSEQIRITNASKDKYNLKFFCLNMDRKRLYERIDKRVDIMLENSLLGEVDMLIKMGVPKNSTAMQAIGYKELVRYIDGEITFDSAVEMIKQESRRYAKRQLTWFRRDSNIKWIDTETEDVLKTILG